MVGTIDDGNFGIHKWISSKYASCKAFFNTFDNSRDVFARDNAANDLADNFVTFSCFVWLKFNLNVSNLTRGSLHSASLGYWIDERFAGRGAMPTTVALVTDHCFDVVGLHHNWMDVLDSHNVDYVVFQPDQPLTTALATLPNWHLAYADKLSVIYVRG